MAMATAIAFPVAHFTPKMLTRPKTSALFIINQDGEVTMGGQKVIELSSSHHNHHQGQRKRFSQQLQQQNENQMTTTTTTTTPLMGRREAISAGLGLYTGLLLDALFFQLPKPAGAAAAPPPPCELTVTPSGLAFCDKVVGTGPEAVKGQLIKAHYVGKLENGKVFDSSYNRGKPLTFRVGVGEVIKGWDQGILGGDGVPPMLAGGKRILKLPPDLGYGIRGAGCRGGSCIIPPDSVLFFDVEFIGKA